MMEMLLLGAGASVEAKVPSALYMTKEILLNLRRNRQFKKNAHVLSFVIGGLIFDASIKNKNPLQPEINVEDLFNAVQLLGERKELEAAPFIGSWHSFVDELDKIYPPKPNGSIQKLIYESVSKELLQAFSQKPSSFASSVIDRSLEINIHKNIQAALSKRSVSISSSESVGRAVEKYLTETVSKWTERMKRSPSSFRGEVDQQVERAISANTATSGNGRIFRETNRYMIAALKDLVWINDSSVVHYLAPILNLLKTQDQVTIATLNYDNSIEMLCESFGVHYSTGIEEWSQQGSLQLKEEGVNLLKLHGSIDWKKMDAHSNATMPTPTYSKIDATELVTSDFIPAVIFGNRNKLTAEGPYLDILRAFSEQLERTSKLTVIGYSFRDIHINTYVSRWLNGDANRSLFVVNGSGFDVQREQGEVEDYIQVLVEFERRNPGRISFIDSNAGDGLISLYGINTAKQKQSVPEARRSAMAEVVEESVLDEAFEVPDSELGQAESRDIGNEESP